MTVYEVHYLAPDNTRGESRVAWFVTDNNPAWEKVAAKLQRLIDIQAVWELEVNLVRNYIETLWKGGLDSDTELRSLLVECGYNVLRIIPHVVTALPTVVVE